MANSNDVKVVFIETNENGVNWYEIDGEGYGLTLDGRLLDNEGSPMDQQANSHILDAINDSKDVHKTLKFTKTLFIAGICISVTLYAAVRVKVQSPDTKVERCIEVLAVSTCRFNESNENNYILNHLQGIAINKEFLSLTGGTDWNDLFACLKIIVRNMIKNGALPELDDLNMDALKGLPFHSQDSK